MLYPNRLQSMLLFDRRIHDLEVVVRDFARIERMKSGTQFNMPQADPDRFHSLLNSDEELTLTFEYRDGPPAVEAFSTALASRFTALATPDIQARLARAQSHILLHVSHGAMDGLEDDPKIAKMFDTVGDPKSGATQVQFQRRLSLLALMSRVVIEHAMPLAVHWAQSDLVISGEQCDAFAARQSPGPLDIHPILYGPQPAPGQTALVGIRTFGARHWLGREILVKPGVLPWAANYDAILAFMRIATMDNGYVIPDGDTFGPDDRSLSYRVLYHDIGANIGFHEAEPAEVPMYELVPLRHVAHSFVAQDGGTNRHAFDDQSFPAEFMPEDQDAKAALANEWAEKRKLVEGIGGRLEVSAARDDGEVPQSPAPKPPERTNNTSPDRSAHNVHAKVFGRKGL